MFVNLHSRVSSSKDLRECSVAVHDWENVATSKTFGQILGPVERIVNRLAEQFGKRVHLKMIGSSVRLSGDHWGHVFQNLIHLLRNSIDHGIESPDLRGKKPVIGTLTVFAVKKVT